MTARLQLAGFASTGEADLNDEIGSGSTPRNGAGSIATVWTRFSNFFEKAFVNRVTRRMCIRIVRFCR